MVWKKIVAPLWFILKVYKETITDKAPLAKWRFMSPLSQQLFILERSVSTQKHDINVLYLYDTSNTVFSSKFIHLNM